MARKTPENPAPENATPATADAPPPPPPPAAEVPAPGPENATPAATEPARKGFVSGRGGAAVSPEAIQRGIEARNQQSVFNSYVNASGRESAQLRKDRARVTEITATLDRGTEIKSVAAWAGKGAARKRAGTVEKAVKILPARKLALMSERSAAEARIKIAEAAPRVTADQRAEFLRILPPFAARKGYDRSMLIEAGVPEADVIAARIK